MSESKNKAKVRRMEQRFMSVAEVREMQKMGWECAWKGCEAVTMDRPKDGWSSLLLYKGPTQPDFIKIDPRNIARDCVLCLEHARRLDENLLKDSGGRLRSTAGSA